MIYRYRLLLLIAFQVTRADSKQFHSYLENAATTGRPLLVEDIDQPFDRTISRLVCMKQDEWRLMIGDKELKVADGFRLHLTTRLARPLQTHETPEYIHVVDFSLSDDAITDQLLSCILQHDKPVSRMISIPIRPFLIIFLAEWNILVTVFRLNIRPTMNDQY